MKASLFSDLKFIYRFWPFIKPNRSLLFVALAFIPLASFSGVIQPYLLKRGIDNHILQGDLSGLIKIAILFFVFVCLEYLLQALQLSCLQIVGQKSIGRLRSATFSHVLHLPQRYLDHHPTGALLTRSTTDIEALSESLAMGVVSILGDLFTLGGTVVAMMILDVRLSLLLLLLMPVILGIIEFFRRRQKHLFLLIRKALATLNGYLQEQLAGIQIVQLFGHEKESQKTFKSLNYTFFSAYTSANFYDAFLYAAMDGLAAFTIATIIWYGSGLHLKGIISLGLLIAFIEYIQKLFIPIREFSAKFATLQRATTALERIFDLLDTQGDTESIVVQPSHTSHETVKRPGIEFQDVFFRYKETGPDVLNGISLTVLPGEVVALVGATGSGKTTIGKLLTRIYDGYRGNIWLNGVEISRLSKHVLRKQIGMVQQDVFLFHDTISANISLDNPNMTKEAIKAATERVYMTSLLSELPGGLNFVVSERGANLSAGQAQLIALARLMADNPPIVILDEATASVDSITEHLIQEGIRTILKEKTVIVIAHRLSTILQANRIFVMHQGKIVESGKHEELLALNGYYSHLWRALL